MQETKAQEHQLPPEALDIPGSPPLSSTPKRKATAASRSMPDAGPERIVRGLSMDEYDAEGRFVRMDFAGGLSVASLYVPSGTSGPARQPSRKRFSITSLRCSCR